MKYLFLSVALLWVVAMIVVTVWGTQHDFPEDDE